MQGLTNKALPSPSKIRGAFICPNGTRSFLHFMWVGGRRRGKTGEQAGGDSGKAWEDGAVGGGWVGVTREGWGEVGGKAGERFGGGGERLGTLLGE